MKKIVLFLTICLAFKNIHAQVYKSVEKKGNILFHSYTPMEDIDAKTDAANSLLNSINDSSSLMWVALIFYSI